MPEQFDIAARRHLGAAVALEAGGYLDDAGYHFGLVGENAVKYAVVTACGSLPRSLRQHFALPLRNAISNSAEVASVLMNGRLSLGLAQDIQNGSFNRRFDQWNIAIRYADSSHPVTTALVSAWRTDALALIGSGVP